jgi:hypothetical protein
MEKVACDPAAKVTEVLLNKVVAPDTSKEAAGEVEDPLGAFTVTGTVTVPPAPWMPEKLETESKGDARLETATVVANDPGPGATKFESVDKILIVCAKGEVLVNSITPVENSVALIPRLRLEPTTPKIPGVSTRPNTGPLPPFVRVVESSGNGPVICVVRE